MSVHRCDNGAWVIASGGCWLPGVYEDEKTARYAFQFKDEVLAALMAKVRPKPITMAMLKEAREGEGG